MSVSLDRATREFLIIGRDHYGASLDVRFGVPAFADPAKRERQYAGLLGAAERDFQTLYTATGAHLREAARNLQHEHAAGANLGHQDPAVNLGKRLRMFTVVYAETTAWGREIRRILPMSMGNTTRAALDALTAIWGEGLEYTAVMAESTGDALLKGRAVIADLLADQLYDAVGPSELVDEIDSLITTRLV
ncbi:hypothetical protein [Streptomyces niveus]|uniref:hypothetical protein n=1 Tax=Streptomyces niveus TaxID=193462 RepID=UPI00343F9BCC